MPGKPKKISIFPLLTVSLMGTLGYSIMLPFLVFLVKEFKGNEFLYGALGASYSVFQMIGAPFLGRMSDRYGRKKLLFICEAGTFVSWAVFFVALYLPMDTLFHFSSGALGHLVVTLPLFILFLARSVDGITAGDISVANAYLSDISDENSLKKNYGKMSASSNLGFILGPLLAGALGATALGLKLPIIATAVISLAALFFIAFGLPESDLALSGNAAEKVGLSPHKRPSFSFLLSLPNVPMMLALYFFIYLGFNFFYIGFPLYAADGLHWNVTQMGVFFAFLSGTMVLVQGPLLSYLSKKFTDEKLTIAGGFILAANFECMLSHQTLVLYMGALLFSLGNGLMWPSFLAVLSRVAGHTWQGAVQGLASSAGSLASIIGLIAGGILYHTFHENIFLISGAIILGVSIFSFRLLRLKATAQASS